MTKSNIVTVTEAAAAIGVSSISNFNVSPTSGVSPLAVRITGTAESASGPVQATLYVFTENNFDRTWTLQGSFTTNADGTFSEPLTLDALNGQYTQYYVALSASSSFAGALTLAPIQVDVYPSVSLPGSFSGLQATYDVQYPGSVSISGKLLDTAGNPLPNAEVDLDEGLVGSSFIATLARATTYSDGSFALAWSPPALGDWPVYCVAPSSEPAISPSIWSGQISVEAYGLGSSPSGYPASLTGEVLVHLYLNGGSVTVTYRNNTSSGLAVIGYATLKNLAGQDVSIGESPSASLPANGSVTVTIPLALSLSTAEPFTLGLFLATAAGVALTPEVEYPVEAI